MVNGDEHDYEDFDEEQHTTHTPAIPLCGACGTPIHRGQGFYWAGKFAAHKSNTDCIHGRLNQVSEDMKFLKACGIQAYA